MKPDHYLTCAACGWVHFSVTRAEAEKLALQAHADIARYERCFNCSRPHTQMKPSMFEDCPRGVTLQPIIGEP